MWEQVENELESSNVLPLISSPSSSDWQIGEPGMLYFDCSSLPSTPMEELTLWTHSFTHQSGTAKAQDLAGRLLEEDFLKALEDFIRRTVRKLFEERLELIEQQKVFNVRFEETVYTAGTSQCMQFDAKFPPKESARHSSQQRSITEHGSLKRKVDAGSSGQNLTIFESGNKQKTNKKSKKTWGIGESVSLEDLKEQFGKKREEAAASLHVSISTFKRICRERGISRWPSTKIKRERLLLSSISCNETDQVAANVQMPITRGPTAFASTISVKSNLQKSWSSNLSVNNENGTSFNENFLGKNEDSDRESIMIQVGDSANQELLYEPQEFEPACDSLIPSYSFPNAPTILSQLPQQRMSAKDATQFISPSLGQQRKVIARQIKMLQAMLVRLSKNAAAPVSNLPKMHYFWRSRHTPNHIFGESDQHRTDETSQLENQYLGRERLNRNTEKEVILSVEDSSSYDFRSVSEPIQGHLTDYASVHRLNEDQLISVDDMECTRIEAQSTVESKSEPSIQSDARRMKFIFEKLIMLPLEALSNPNHEASMKEALTILTGNLSLFTDEQAKQLLELKFDFPTTTYSWRDCSRTRIDCQDFLTEFEKTKSLLETSTKKGEDLKDKYSQLESKEKEMMAQLAAIQKEKNEITERRSENFNQTKHLVALAEEQAGRTKEKELQITIATAKLNKLKNQWVSFQSSFI